MLVLPLVLTAALASAQLKEFPLERPGLAPVKTADQSTARKQSVAPLTLPFWDDFHKPYKTLFADTAHWENSFSVWVNDGIAIQAPTLNVATFDGLDSAGRAYNPNDILVTGYTDQLVSRPIDLGTGPNGVPPELRNTVYLSFFYQCEGNGEPPDGLDDFLQVDFKNADDEWETVHILTPSENLERNKFYSAIIPVSDDRFFHDHFQFRFRSYGRQSGPYDTWNIDYVYLNKNRNANDLSFPDRAAASTISPLFAPYTAVPYLHFLVSPQMDNVQFDVQNLKNTFSSTNYRAFAEYTNFRDGVAYTSFKTLVSAEGVKGGAGDMEPFERVRARLSVLPDVNEFDPDADSAKVTLIMKVISNDSIDSERFKFAPVNLQVNDTVITTYWLKDYYAYDDGIAEYAAGLIQPGNLIAYAFDLPEGLYDTLKVLKGFDIYFPPYAITSNQTIDFFIYREQDGLPGEVWMPVPARKIERSGLNRFQRFTFLPGLQIDSRRFFIGWKHPVAGRLLVGLDKSHDTGDRIFVNTNGFWYPNEDVRGSLMIRPVFGTGVVDPTTGIVDEEKSEWSVFPNPNNGHFILEGEPGHIEILSLTGHPIMFLMEPAGPGRTYISTNTASGIYLLRYTTQQGRVKTRKLVILR